MQTISLTSLAFAFIPVAIVIVILWRWKLPYRTSIYAVARMLVQLLLVGYFLVYIFEADRWWVIILVLTIMLAASSWISLRTIKAPRLSLYGKSLLAITIGGGAVLALISQGVLSLNPWFKPSFMIPLAGMIFANAMNSISLAAERLQAEMRRGQSYQEARVIALQASMIPIVNSLFAVGLVSLPGMMTGQILSGVEPIVAARYQIMVMCMIFGSTGISVSLFLSLIRQEFSTQDNLPTQPGS